jgi:hypothetical protein
MKNYLSIVLGFFILIFSINKAFAASSITNGITVSPAIQQISLAKNQVTANFNVEIINNTNSQQFVEASSQDFTYLNENGAVSFFNSTLNKNDTHGLVNFMNIGLPEIALAPHQSKVVPVTIFGANKLSDGGHYAAIVFKAYPLNTKKSNFAFIQAVSSLVFLSTYGGGTQNLSLDTVIISSVDINLPEQITTVIGNSGNTQTAPSGYVQILNPQHKLVSQSQINVFQVLILPQSKRLLVVNLNHPHQFLWPGFYTVKIFYDHSGQTKYMVYQKRVFLITEPFLIVIIVFVIVFVGWIIRRSKK